MASLIWTSARAMVRRNRCEDRRRTANGRYPMSGAMTVRQIRWTRSPSDAASAGDGDAAPRAQHNLNAAPVPHDHVIFAGAAHEDVNRWAARHPGAWPQLLTFFA